MRQQQKNGERRLAPVEFWFFLVGSIFAGLLFLELLLEIFFTLHISARVFLVTAMGICFYIATYLYASRTGDTKPLRIVQFSLFAIYLACLLDITLVGNSIGRHHYDKERIDYIDWFVNLRPFRTIRNYLVGFSKGSVSLRWLTLNLLGNLLLLAPLSLFLPLLFKHPRHWYFYLPTVLLTSAGIEALQYFFMVGSCDVDDLILNFIGAAALFFLLKIPPLRRLIRFVTMSKF